MPAPLFPDSAIPALAEKLDGAMTTALNLARQSDVANDSRIDERVAAAFHRLAELGCVDPAMPEDGMLGWAINANGKRLLDHLLAQASAAEDAPPDDSAEWL
jgi:hypothetical protein